VKRRGVKAAPASNLSLSSVLLFISLGNSYFSLMEVRPKTGSDHTGTEYDVL